MNIKAQACEIAGKMTLDEKIGMIHGAEFFRTAGVPRLHIPPLTMSDGTMGVRQEFRTKTWKPEKHTEDASTYLPCGSAVASTWNRKLAFETGCVLGEEARGRGKDIILAPGINIMRSPLCGRSFEYMGEDPYLTGEMASSYIRGVQSFDVAACVKHYALNNQETERLWVDVQADEKVIREIYLPAFYDALKKGGAYTVMAAYNRAGGEHCSLNRFLLHDVLRKEWGFDGLIISDWGGVHDTVKTASGELDIEMSVTDNFDDYFFAEPLKKAIRDGKVREEAVNDKVVRILMLMIRLHMLDGRRQAGTYNTPAHRRTALETARESIILLKNENNALPFDRNKIHKLLLVGENADTLHAGGGGSAEMKALYEVSPYLGIKALLGGNTEITYAQGYCRGSQKKESELDWQEKSLENGGGSISAAEKENKRLEAKRKRLRTEAAGLAKDADAVLFIGGLNHEFDCEGRDRSDMKLPYGQEKVIQELLAVRPDTVVVLIGGSPVEMGGFIQKTSAVLWSFYAGMEGGTALAEVLFGVTNPSGKLPETFFKYLSDYPPHALGEFPGGSSVEYKEGKYVGYRFGERYGVEPEFCFGHGLSYTEFCIFDVSADLTRGTVSCSVKNTGGREGRETVQVYRMIKNEDGGSCRELAGFEKTELQKGETKKLEIQLRPADGGELYIGTSLDSAVKI